MSKKAKLFSPYFNQKVYNLTCKENMQIIFSSFFYRMEFFSLDTFSGISYYLYFKHYFTHEHESY